jgi:hypothetical protein
LNCSTAASISSSRTIITTRFKPRFLIAADLIPARRDDAPPDVIDCGGPHPEGSA